MNFREEDDTERKVRISDVVLEALNTRDQEVGIKWKEVFSLLDGATHAFQEIRGDDEVPSFLFTIESNGPNYANPLRYRFRLYIKEKGKDLDARKIAAKTMEPESKDDPFDWSYQLDKFLRQTMQDLEETFDTCYKGMHLLKDYNI